MKNEGYNCSHKRVMRLMKELDIKCKRSVRANNIVIPQKSKNPEFKNKLKRNFYPAEPNKVWFSDFSQFNVDYTHKYYICIILDLFSRKVVGFAVADHMRTDLLIHTLDKALEERRPVLNELMFHSDQGCQYTDTGFRNKLADLQIEQSFSSAGTPYDNAVMEAFFSCLKREQLYVEEINNFEDLLHHVKYYINFYNNLRPHQALNYKTPAQVEKEYVDAHS